MAITIVAVLFWSCLLTVAYSYVGYPLLLRLLAALFGRPSSSGNGAVPSVAMIIPVYNEEKVLAQKLANTLALDYPADKLAVWVGSDQSSDRTDEIVTRHASGRVRLWRSPARGGKTGTINALVPLVDADVIVITDADIMLETTALRALVRHYADPSVGGVGGQTMHVREGDERAEEGAYRSFEARQKQHESLLHSTIGTFGSFYSARRPLIRPLPPNAYSNDDVIIPLNVIRQGYRFVFEIDALSTEVDYADPKREYRRRVRIGAGNFQAFFWFLDFLNPLRGWPWFCYVSHKVTRWFSPFILLTGLTSCGVLALLSPMALYRLLFIMSMVFIGAAACSGFVPGRLNRALAYFLLMNVALGAGFLRYLKGIRAATWESTVRG